MAVSKLDDILKKLHTLESELESEIDRVMNEKREQFRYTLEQGKVRFEQEARALHKKYRDGSWHYLTHARLGHIVSAPIIYSVIVPLFLLDMFVTVYQWLCFPLYGIPKVKRCRYMSSDRNKLAYLNMIEKFNCMYCGYGNSVIEYTREITARTEQYWCPIKHARRSPDPHRLVDNFVDYGDAESYRQKLKQLQDEVRVLRDMQQ